MLVAREHGRAGHEAAVVGLRAGFLFFDGVAHAVEKIFLHGGEAKPTGVALCQLEARAAGREVAVQIGNRVGSRMIGIVQLRDELGMVAFEPAQEGSVENATGVHGHGGVLGGGEGEDEGGEIHGKEPKGIRSQGGNGLEFWNGGVMEERKNKTPSLHYSTSPIRRCRKVREIFIAG